LTRPATIHNSSNLSSGKRKASGLITGRFYLWVRLLEVPLDEEQKRQGRARIVCCELFWSLKDLYTPS
jgi:hypothetical protein